MIYTPESIHTQPTGQASSWNELAESMTKNLWHYWKEYARENPTAAGLWCFSIGFVLGWKLKPW
jgi:hypothetical protein